MFKHLQRHYHFTSISKDFIFTNLSWSYIALVPKSDHVYLQPGARELIRLCCLPVLFLFLLFHYFWDHFSLAEFLRFALFVVETMSLYECKYICVVKHSHRDFCVCLCSYASYIHSIYVYAFYFCVRLR